MQRSMLSCARKWKPLEFHNFFISHSHLAPSRSGPEPGQIISNPLIALHFVSQMGSRPAPASCAATKGHAGGSDKDFTGELSGRRYASRVDGRSSRLQLPYKESQNGLESTEDC